MSAAELLTISCSFSDNTFQSCTALSFSAALISFTVATAKSEMEVKMACGKKIFNTKIPEGIKK